MAEHVPAIRIQQLNQQPIAATGEYVVYWMNGSRRLTRNFALDRAIEHSRSLNKPLLIFEAIRCDYRWASRRLHAFVLQGMSDNSGIAAKSGHLYVPWVETEFGAGSGLMQAIAGRAAVVVTDDFPCFFSAVNDSCGGSTNWRADGSSGFERFIADACHIDDFPDSLCISKIPAEITAAAS